MGFLGAGLGSLMYKQVQPMRLCVLFVGFLGAGLGSLMDTQLQPLRLCFLLTKSTSHNTHHWEVHKGEWSEPGFKPATSRCTLTTRPGSTMATKREKARGAA